MSIKTYLFDAEGNDKEVPLSEQVVAQTSDKQLLWVDMNDSDQRELTLVGNLLSLESESVWELAKPARWPRVQNYGRYFQTNIKAVQPFEHGFRFVEVDLLSGPNWVLTSHAQPASFIEDFDEYLKGDTQIGRLDSASLIAALLDWYLTAFFQVVDKIEEHVDTLDEQALTNKAGHRFLHELVEARQRVSELRRVVTPHRPVFAALAGPDLEVMSTSEAHMRFRELQDRLERLIDTLENAREMVVGTFELFATATAHSTNDTVKVLTVVTVVLGLLSVIAGVLGMNFQPVPFFDTGPMGFLLAVAGMVLLTIAGILIARWRGMF